MAKSKPADLEQFSVKRTTTAKTDRPGDATVTAAKQPSKLMTKGFRITPEAAQQFEMLRSELGRGRNKDMGPKLIAEALNLLFQKHGKQPIA